MKRTNALKALCIMGAITFGQASAAVCPVPKPIPRGPGVWCRAYPEHPDCELLVGHLRRIGQIGQIWALQFNPADRFDYPITLKDSDGNKINVPEKQEARFEIKGFDKENSLVRGTLDIPPPTPERRILDILFSKPKPVSPSIVYENATLSCGNLRYYGKHVETLPGE